MTFGLGIFQTLSDVVTLIVEIAAVLSSVVVLALFALGLLVEMCDRRHVRVGR